MSPHLHKDNLLNSCGCLTLTALERYRDKGLNSEETAEVEDHLSGCQMCRDALEGLTMLPSGSSARTGIREINARLRKRHRYVPAGMGNERKSPRLSQFIIPAAASIILLASIIGYFNYFLPEKQELALVETEEVLPSVPQHKESENQQIAAINEEGEDDVITEENTPGENRDIERIEESKIESEAVLDEVKAEENTQTGAGALVDDEFVAIIVVEDDSTIEPAMYGAAEDDEIMADEDLAMQEPSISAFDNEEIIPKEVAGAELEQKMSQSKSQAKRRSNEEPQEAIFMVVETMPEFPGGERSLFKYIQANIMMPADTIIHKADTAYVSFIVNKDGNISDVILLKGIWDKFDQEAIRMVKSMPAWKPGKQRGQPVRVNMILPVTYSP